ncbi:MAG TPA: hypothetical protein VNO21_06240 [Polyangiaceae bacterium]|nr:hypothetical protein [Polyangiaceae bacterium]
MRYYTYISDTKIDQLLPQISPSTKKKLAAELKIDLKILAGSIRTEQDLVDNRISRCDVVTRYILAVNGKKFRDGVLSRGATKDAHQLYLDFRGREPNANVLLEQRGLK